MRELYMLSHPVNIDADGKATLTPKPLGDVYVVLPDGSSHTIVADVDGVIDVSDLIVNDCVKVTYRYNGGARAVEISADKAPFIGKLVLEGTITDNLLGKVGKTVVEIPSFAVSDNITITMNADGTTSDTVLTGVALATSGAQCMEGYDLN